MKVRNMVLFQKSYTDIRRLTEANAIAPYNENQDFFLLFLWNIDAMKVRLTLSALFGQNS